MISDSELQQALLDCKKSDKELAHILNVSTISVTRWRRGESLPQEYIRPIVMERLAGVGKKRKKKKTNDAGN